MREAIKNRISRRVFTGEALGKPEIEKIQELVRRVNQQSALTIELMEEAGTVFHSLKKSYGLFQNVRSLLVMKGAKTDVNLKEKVGYYGERIVLDVTDMGLGTCWVGATFDKACLAIPAREELVCVIVLGRVAKLTVKEKMIRAAAGANKNRKAVEERLSSSAEIPSWLREGVEAVRLAPSARNKQKPHFNYDGTLLTVSTPEESDFDLVDLGIAKMHFEAAVGGLFGFGNGAAFSMKEMPDPGH